MAKLGVTQVKLKETIFGFEKNYEYSATESECGQGYIVINGTFKGFVYKSDVEIVG